MTKNTLSPTVLDSISTRITEATQQRDALAVEIEQLTTARDVLTGAMKSGAKVKPAKAATTPKPKKRARSHRGLGGQIIALLREADRPLTTRQIASSLNVKMGIASSNLHHLVNHGKGVFKRDMTPDGYRRWALRPDLRTPTAAPETHVSPRSPYVNGHTTSAVTF